MFDFCLMNPPYSKKQQYLDMQFAEKCNKISNIVISVQPGQKITGSSSITAKEMESGHLKEFELFDANEAFKISTTWKYGGIYLYDNSNLYKTIKCKKITGEIENINTDIKSRQNFYNHLKFKGAYESVIKSKTSLYNQLMNNYKTMVNDIKDKMIYWEKDLGRGKKRFGITKQNPNYSLDYVKEKLKNKEYKYCIVLGSYNGNYYDQPKEWKGEDIDKFFKNQLCWLFNEKNIKNNVKYWMECPLFDMWKRWFTNGRYRINASGCFYGFIPAVDFNKDESDFKEYVDSLNDFTDEEIKILKDNNIHNADKL